MRLLFVQYCGDYREAFNRFSQGGGETYYAQKYSVEAVADIAQKVEEVAVLCCMTTEQYSEILPNGVRAIGAGFSHKVDADVLIQSIEAQKPTHLVLTTPLRPIFSWAIRQRISTIAVLADSFSNGSLRERYRNFQLSRMLNHNQISWVGNHGINSCLSLKEIGVKASKTIPWDWPAVITPDAFSAKTLPRDKPVWNLVYVGSVSELKGVGDILEAVSILKSQGWSVSLKIAGKGEIDHFTLKAKQLGIEDCVEFLGLVQNSKVVYLMREADVVLVPSRHNYPEGVPMTIYEALCSRTPIVASDHPMFRNNLKSGVNAVIFPAGDSDAFAKSIQNLLSDATLYEEVSQASHQAWNHLQIPVKWADLIQSWLFDSPENQKWLFKHRLASEHYSSKLVS